jgi:uncharacterized protein YjbJ (UPF0337 family)
MAIDKKHGDDTLSEETSALGERVKGAVKERVGAMTGNAELERDGERENAEGRARQARNDVFEETDGEPGETVKRRSATWTAAPDSGLVPIEEVRNSAVLDRPAPSSEDDTVSAPGTPRTWDSSWSDRHLVTGLYETPERAREAYQDLTTRHGYKDDDISVVMTDETRQEHFGDVKPGTELKEGTKAAEGAGIGGGIGLGVGAALGAIVAGATAIAIPGLGLLVAGPIAGAIAGAGAGGATGTLLGALIGAGIPEIRAVEYERGLKEGGIVLGTRARDEAHAAELERDFDTYGARKILR